MNLSPALIEKIKKIRLIVFDVDGVMTDGGIMLDDTGEIKRFDAKDGAGIKYLQRLGIKVAIITGRKSKAVEKRARELNINECCQGCKKKLPALMQILEKFKVTEEECACMGDDLPDIPLMNHCGLKLAPADAVPDVLNIADIVSSNPGGKGAVREMAELILKTQGKWQGLLEGYLGQ
jgi:3-deoxy-D-manno-octulosonate 8-phosphate phosphatase (KDO 8-P phosphatase)